MRGYWRYWMKVEEAEVRPGVKPTHLRVLLVIFFVIVPQHVMA
jgi:hypothetical protein